MSTNANTCLDRTLTRAEGKTSRRANVLFKVLSTDRLLREQFVTDPAQIMSEYLFGERLPEETSDAANQLLYSVISNPGLRNWMAKYSKQLNEGTPTRHEFALQFARAAAVSGDELTTLALIRGASESSEHFVVQADLLRAIIAVIGGHFGSGGTEMSPGGTQMSPGAIFAGTEMSPGGGTEVSPGGTQMSPGAIFAGTEMSPGGGTEMSPGGTQMSPGAIFAGTEMSPGGGTEMSPGGGTEMSPGAQGIGRLSSHLQVTFDALVQYASQLRARGALISSGLESR
jgi:hypothetical protein